MLRLDATPRGHTVHTHRIKISFNVSFGVRISER